MCWVCQTRSSPVIIPTRCKLVQLHHCAPSFPLVRYNATCMLALANRDEEACNLLGQLFACGGVSRVDVANDPDLGGRLWVQGLLSSWQRPVHDQWISFCVCVCVYVCVNSRAKLQHGIRCCRWCSCLFAMCIAHWSFFVMLKCWTLSSEHKNKVATSGVCLFS